MIEIYTDGGARPTNPGPGGWAFAIVVGTDSYRGHGGERLTTNNRMELMAVIESLRRAIKLDFCLSQIVVYADSEYVVKGVNNWLAGWKRRGWRTSNRKDVKNRDLWERLDHILNFFVDVEFEWVRGHDGNEWNEVVDADATAAALAAAR